MKTEKKESRQHGLFHVYTENSPGDTAKIEEMFKRAAELQAECIVITDKNTIMSYVKAAKLAQQSGIKTIVGVELELNEGTFLLIPKDDEGFSSILKLVNCINLQSEPPVVSLELLKKVFAPGHEGYGHVILTTGGTDGFAWRLAEQFPQRLLELCTDIKNIFEGNIAFEIQTHEIPGEENILSRIIDTAAHFDAPILVGQDARYTTRAYQDIRRQQLIEWKDNKNIPNSASYSKMKYEVQSDEQLRKAFGKYLDAETIDRALAGIREITEQCDGVSPQTDLKLPAFENAAARLHELVELGILNRFGAYAGWNQIYEERVKEELEIIRELKYESIICICEDIISYARKRGREKKTVFSAGPGRGSAAGSLVCYLLGITDCDPIVHKLQFSRWLNRHRKSLPDIDIDIAPLLRGDIYKYLASKYGMTSICGLSTKTRIGMKSAIEYCGKMHKASAEHIEALKRNVESGIEIDNGKDGQIVEDAEIMKGCLLSTGQHPAGIVIAPGVDLRTKIPVRRNDEGFLCTQLDATDMEYIGYIKIDLLDLQTLDFLSAVSGKAGAGGYQDITYEDRVFRNIYAKGLTGKVFQFESSGMKELLKRFGPENFEELMMLIALYRPGPMKYIDRILQIREGNRQPVYLCRELKEILQETYGYAVYQEQLIEIFKVIGGIDYEEADLIRYNIAKKKETAITEEMKEKLLGGLGDRGISQGKAEQFLGELISFGKFAFNKSHAAVYARLSYFSAHLKYYCTADFYTLLLINCKTSERGAIIYEASRMGITILGPDINLSGTEFEMCGPDQIRYGLSIIQDAAAIVNEREKNGVYTSIKDLLRRVELSEESIEILCLSGTLDCWSKSRKLFAWYGKNLRRIKKQMERYNGNGSSGGSYQHGRKQEMIKKHYRERFEQYAMPDINTGCSDSELAEEFRILGAYLSENPLERYAEQRTQCTSGLSEVQAGAVRICGIIRTVELRERKADKKTYAHITLIDEEAEMKILCFTAEYERYSHYITEGSFVVATGIAKKTDGRDSFMGKQYFMIASRIQSLEEISVITTKPAIKTGTDSA